MPIIGTAGWSIPRVVADRFPAEGSALARYATIFTGVEINSTFYRRHKPSTFARWAESVPAGFRFAVKMSKRVTHELKLQDTREANNIFLRDIAPLGEKLGPILCQLPPSLTFDATIVGEYFTSLRLAHGGEIVVEPRHPSWATEEATALLNRSAIARVFADPAPIDPPATAVQAYMRLHGKPKIYYSSYSKSELKVFATMLSAESWCILDNTASGAAIDNALEMQDLFGAA
jgi:uncharacterized protein YecE (DUF72 family)